MTKEWRWWLGEAGTAVVVAFVSSYFTKDVPVSVLYGLFGGTVFYVLREHARLISEFGRKMTEWENKALGLPATLSYPKNVDTYLQQQVRLKKEELLRLAKGAEEGEIVLRPRSVQQAAIDFLKQTKPGEKIFATSYVNPEAFWCTPEGQLYREDCFELVDQGVEITRVFIESTGATEREKQCIVEELERQKGHKNLKLRRTLGSRLPPDARKDMLLIADRYVAYLGIGRGDTLEELKICTAPEQVEKAKTLAENIVKLSDEYEARESV